MNRRKRLIAVVGGLLVGAALAAAGLWYFLLRSDEPPPVSLEAASTAAAGNGGSSSAPSDVSGTWTVTSGSGSFAGYRVNENLVGFGARTAVGRTQDVQGSLSFDGKSISSVHLNAGLTSLQSDQSLRDDTIRMQALQSCRFPTATFDLTSPIAIDASFSGGNAISKTVQGSLTLHGITKPVSIDVKGQYRNGQVVVAGSTTIAFADYGIEQPRSFYVVSLDDHGIMEFQLVFSKAAGSTVTAAAPTSTPTGCSGGFQPPPNFTPGAFPPGGGPGRPGGPGPATLPPLPTPAPVPSPVS